MFIEQVPKLFRMLYPHAEWRGNTKEKVVYLTCEKDNAQKHDWLPRTWYGEYETKVQNNDTGEYTTVTASIVLEFSDDKSRCTVKRAYSGLLSMNSKTYYSSVYDDTKAFSLREHSGDVEIVYVSEIVSDKRILKWREGNEERVIKIEAMMIE